MVQIITAIKDKKAETYNGVNTAITAGTAVRDLMRFLNNGQKNDLNQFPEDFELWQLGEINTTTGEIVPKLKKIIGLKDLVDNTKSEATDKKAQ